MRISVDFEFSAAHHLPAMPKDHQCRRPHGHNYRVRVTLLGVTERATGLVMDFATVEALIAAHVMARVDHRNLNDLLSNPTAENIAAWVFAELQRHLLLIEEVTVWETDRYSATLRLGDRP